nr:biotin/lipoate A/B protein ligase family protein [Oscillatoria sp. FACHB-1406]
MAIDRWIFDRYCRGEMPPTIRFYTWEPAAISLGYHQRRFPESWRSLTCHGKPIDLVRRPTGGRAVLHQGDLCYAIVTSEMGESRDRTYETLCEFLIQGWRSLGIELHYGHAERGYIGQPGCFSTATAADLVTAQGQKAIGSAQLRRDRTILQHGSMILSSPSSLYQQVFGDTASAPIWGDSSAIPVPVILEALTEAARHCFAVDFAIEPLSETEWQEIF